MRMKARIDPSSFHLASLAALLLAAFATQPAMAERPMAVDDAGTLDRGGAKLEGGWSKDDRVRGWDIAAGFGPIDNVEVEIAFERAYDHDTNPNTRLSGVGFAAKWVPLQNETGLSAGLKFEFGRAKADDRIGNKETARTRGLIGLASWNFESRQIIHLNLGREWERIDGDTEAVNVWGLGFEQPLAETLQFTVEIFGAEHSRPDKQVGLRWEIASGLKLSVAAGRGSGRSIANAGIAWEF
jgi:hypothetical protein